MRRERRRPPLPPRRARLTFSGRPFASRLKWKARPLDSANFTSCEASSTLKISVVTSLTPIIGVTATAFQAAASDSPSTLLIWPCVAVAASIAYWPMSPLNAGP